MGVCVGHMARFARRAVRVLALTSVVMALMAATGCGDRSREADGGGGDAGRTMPHAPTTNHQLAGAVLMATSDVGSAWRPTPPTPPAACGHTGWEQAAARRGSPSYKLRYGSVQQNVGVFSSVAEAERVFAALKTPRSERCFFKSLRRGVNTGGAESAGSEPKVVRVARARHADETRYVISAESNLGLVSVYADRVRIQTGRVISVLVMVDVNVPIDEAIYERVLSRVRSRMGRTAQTAAS